MLVTRGVKFFLSSLKGAITNVVIGERYEYEIKYGADTVSLVLSECS